MPYTVKYNLTFLLIAMVVTSCIPSQNHLPREDHTDKKQDIVATLKENNHLTVERQVTLYKQLKASYPDAYNFENEDQLTMYGYGMLWEGRLQDARLIFQLIADEFPTSANAYDSLGEAYYNLGNMDKSLENYRISLKMNPDNYNAEDYIKKITFPDKKDPTPEELFDTVYSIEEYISDIDDLATKLVKTHPSIFKFTSQKAFEDIVERTKKLITSKTTYSMFRWHCNEIVASVNCSHTDTGSFQPENDMLPVARRFPIQTAWINDKLYITDPLDNMDRVSVKDEVLTINNLPVPSIVEDIYRHIPSQGFIETTKRHFFNTWSTGLIAYSLNLPTQFEITIKSKSSPIQLRATTRHNDPVEQKPFVDCGDALCLDYVEDTIAVLTIPTFNFYRWNNYNEFTAYLDRSFKEINATNVSHLIIDLRRNGGGAPEASIDLLRYIVDRSFSYFENDEPIQGGGTWAPHNDAFKGDVYFLIDGNGKSTTGHFMAVARHMNLGTIIGEELGSNHFCTAGQTLFKLRNTRLLFYSANADNQVIVDSSSDERGILPDHEVYQNIDDYINGIDVVKGFALQVIKTPKIIHSN